MANDERGVSPPGDPATSAGSPSEATSAGERHQGTPWYRRRWIIVVTILLLGLFLLHRFTRSPPQPPGGRAQHCLFGTAVA